MIIGINDHSSTPTVTKESFIVVSGILSAILAITIGVFAITLVAICLKQKGSIRKYHSSPASAAQQNTDKFEDKDVNYEEINELHTSTRIKVEVSENIAYSTMILN